MYKAAGIVCSIITKPPKRLGKHYPNIKVPTALNTFTTLGVTPKPAVRSRTTLQRLGANVNWNSRCRCTDVTGKKGCATAIRVDLDRVHEPVCFFELAGVVCDVRFARVCQGGACGVCGPDVTGPVSAEGGVEDL